jgi:hypothetical protein
MATYQENNQRTLVVDREAQEHNAQISERYQRLKNAEEQQFAEFSNQGVYATTYAPERSAPVQQPTQQPQVPQYGHTRVESPLFTVETLERTWQRNETAYMPAQPEVIPQPQTIVEQTAKAEVQPTYSLTSAAKKMIAAVSVAVTVMMTMIGINSHVLRTQELQIAAQEASNAAARAELVRIQNDISVNSSEEAIGTWAQANGMVKGN